MNPHDAGLLRPFPEWGARIAAAFATRGLLSGASPSDPYDRLNLGFRSGGEREQAAANWRAVLAAEGIPGVPLAMPRMIHGDAWADADAFPTLTAPHDPGHPAWEPEACDALAASTPGKVLAVTMADCLTALIWDPDSSAIAAVHAGWRGTKARILAKVLGALAHAGRIRPERTWVAFGPCLRPQSLAIGPEVAAQLDRRFLTERDGRIHFDMPADNRAQALECGINPGHIRDLGGDTFSEPGRYFSYRRDGAASGRHAAFICLR